MAALDPRFCARAFPSRGKWGPLLTAVRGPLTITASLVAEHRLQTRRLSNCGSRAQLLRGMWDPPRPGLEPVSPAPAGRLSTTASPGKPPFEFWTFWETNQAVEDKYSSFTADKRWVEIRVRCAKRKFVSLYVGMNINKDVNAYAYQWGGCRKWRNNEHAIFYLRRTLYGLMYKSLY